VGRRLVWQLIFSVESLLHVDTAVLEDPTKYAGWIGRLRCILTFFSLVDLASTVPFYVDAFLLRHTDIAASQFLRMLHAPTAPPDARRGTLRHRVFRAQKGLLATAGFVGITVWLAVSALYYLAERRNHDMIYCEACADDGWDAARDWTLDDWGLVDCGSNCTGCYNLYQSNPTASYYALLNLFGEFPHMDAHSFAGQIIIGNGFEDVIAARVEENGNNNDDDLTIEEEGGMTEGYEADDGTLRGRLYNLLHARTAPGALALDHFIRQKFKRNALSKLECGLDQEIFPLLPGSFPLYS